MQIDTTYDSLAMLISDYIRNEQHAAITDVARMIADIFRAQKAMLWRYDAKHDTVTSLCDPKRSIVLEKSLTQKTIRNQKPLLCTHITSDPSYRKDIDNPHDLPLRNLLIYPVPDRNNTIVGLVVLYRTTHERRIFTPTHIRQLDEMKPLLQALWLPKQQAAEVMHAILAKHDHGKQQHEPDPSSDAHPKKEPKTADNDTDELQAHIDTLRTSLETEQKRTEDLKRENRRLQMIIDELTHELKTLQIDHNSTQKEINLLRSRLEQSKQETLASLPTTSQNEPCASNVLFENYAETIAPYPVLWTLSEYLLYGVESAQHDVLRHIETQLERSSILQRLSDTTTLTPLLTKSEKKHDPKKIVAFIETIKRTDTPNQADITVTYDESLPLLLSFDLPKVYEALSHIIFDFDELCDDGAKATFHLSYQVNPTQTKKALLMRLEGRLQESKTATRFRFLNKKADRKNNADRIHFNLAKQIVSTMRGSIRVERDEKKVSYELIVPVRILT